MASMTLERDPVVEEIMSSTGLTEIDARFAAAIARGQVRGDAVCIDSRTGEEVPLEGGSSVPWWQTAIEDERVRDKRAG
jgi:hypothetical protein